MGATVNELTVIDLLVAPGARITKGQKLAELESDKSVFDFESPCDGTIIAVQGRAGISCLPGRRSCASNDG